MTEDAALALDLAPLAAPGALDGPDRSAFESARHEPRVREELAAFERVVGQIGLEVDSVPPRPGVRARVLSAAVSLPSPEAAPRASWRPSLLASLSLAAAALFAIGALTWRSQRDVAC